MAGTSVGSGSGFGGATTTAGVPSSGTQSTPGTNGSGTAPPVATAPVTRSPLAGPGRVVGLSSGVLLLAVVSIGIVGVLLSLLITRRRPR